MLKWFTNRSATDVPSSKEEKEDKKDLSYFKPIPIPIHYDPDSYYIVLIFQAIYKTTSEPWEFISRAATLQTYKVTDDETLCAPLADKPIEQCIDVIATLPIGQSQYLTQIQKAFADILPTYVEQLSTKLHSIQRHYSSGSADLSTGICAIDLYTQHNLLTSTTRIYMCWGGTIDKYWNTFAQQGRPPRSHSPTLPQQQNALNLIARYYNHRHPLKDE